MSSANLDEERLPPVIRAMMRPELHEDALATKSQPKDGGEVMPVSSEQHQKAVLVPRLIQTHISYVILTGTLAYKIKKDVDMGFLDFSTLDKRQHYCQMEARHRGYVTPAASFCLTHRV
jgi:hypothetical protein